MKQLQVIRVVIASPSDVQPERNSIEEAVAELNRGIARDYGLHIETSRWETEASPGFHAKGPQGYIDQALRIEDCDLLIGIFWKRFGTPTLDAKSGTEHEFRTAYEAWKLKKSPQIMIYFKEQPYWPKTIAEIDQLRQVFAFREEFPKEGLRWTFKRKPEFERALRNHLTHFIRTISDSSVITPNQHSPLTIQTQEERATALLNSIGYVKSLGRGNKEDVYINYNSLLAGQNQCYIGTLDEILKLDSAALKKLIKEKTDHADKQILNLVKANAYTSFGTKDELKQSGSE